jgi:hypothetical protein
MHLAAILIGLGALLSGLLAVAKMQHRRAQEVAGLPQVYITGPQSAFNTSAEPPSTPPPMSIGRIAVGVWLGLWLFVFTAAIPAFIIITRLAKSGS